MGALKLTACMKVVAKMGEMDQESLLERLDRYTSDGVPKDRAQVMAASDTLAELIDERREFMAMLREQHPDLFRVTNAIPEDQDVDPDAPDIQRSPGRGEEEIAAARADGWTIADNDLPSREAAERIVKLRTKGNSVVKPMAAWQDAEVRVVESDNPGFWAIETRKVGVKRSPARDITNTPAFRRWFGDSKVVDAEGKPLMAYTATNKDFSEFKDVNGIAGWFSIGSEFANGYGKARFGYWKNMGLSWEEDRMVPAGVNIVPAYLSVENPFDVTTLIARLDLPLNYAEAESVANALGVDVDELLGAIPKEDVYPNGAVVPHRVISADLVRTKFATDAIKAKGFDGVRATEGNAEVYAVFKSNQIKSAIGNNGDFALENADITRSPARSPSEVFGRDIAPVAIKAYKSLSPRAKGIIDGWNVNWSMGQGKLRDSDAFAEVMAAYEPVREKLRQVYGETIPAYRGEQRDGKESEGDRFLFSWTPMREIATGFAINRRGGMPPEIPQSKVDEQIEAYRKTGIARLNGYKFVRQDPKDWEPDGPDYYHIYWRGEMQTDGDDIAEALQSEKAERDEYIATLREKGKLYTANIPVDSVAFIPVNANLRQPEFVAEYNPRKDEAEEIKFSPARDMTDTPEFKAWSGGAPLIRLGEKHEFRSGQPVAVEALHGTTNSDLTEFKRDRASIESDWGAGFYASNTADDVAANYANNDGSDLTRRVARLAEQIANDDEFDGDMDEALSIARQRISQDSPNTLKLYVAFKNPAVLGGKGETFFDYSEPYNEDTDEYGEPAGLLVNFIDALDEAGDGLDVSMRDLESTKAKLLDAAEGEGIKLGDLARIVKDGMSDTYSADGNSSGSSEILRQALEGMGFDGIIDTTVVDKFGPRMIKGAYSMVKAEGMPGMTKDTVHFIAFEPTQLKSATGNRGTFDPNDADITRSPGRTATGAAWDSPSAEKFDDLVYKLQDKLVDTKRVVEAIKTASGAIADDLDVYLQEELYHGRAAKRTEDFVNMELNPLIEQMANDGLKLEDVEEFMHARHAPEANKVIAQRNPGVAELQDGGSGMKTADALQYMATLPADLKQKLEAAAAKVDAIIAKTRELYVDYELESRDTVDAWGRVFQHYIPLQREDKNGSPGLGQGFSVKGKETKGRTGSTRKVVDIMANIAMQREKAIVRGEKNRVSQALVGLATANPNEGFWQVDEVPTERVFNEKTGLVEDRVDPLYKSRENAVIAKIKGADGKVKEHAVLFNEEDPRALRMAQALKNLDANQIEGLLGVSAKITRYFAAINTQYNPVFGAVNLVRDVQGALLNLSSTPLAGDQAKIGRYTISALRGIYADARAARKGKNPTSQWAALWDEFQDVGGQTGYRDLFRTSEDRANAIKDTLNPDAWADSRLGKIFTANGALKVPLAQAKRGAGWIFQWLSDYNLAMENGVRLAAYKAGLEKGMSKEQAASAAKNITVNFNRKGQVSQQAGAMYAFFNASLQGTARLGQTLFDMEPGKPKTIRLSSTGKKIVYGGIMLGSVQALALAAAGFNDDDPPEFARERGLIIPIGGKKYVTIPMPLGFHVIPNIGRIATEFALSGFKDPHERALSLASLFADTFNPIGNSGLSMQTLAPTALDPLVALTENKDWTGKPIARESSNKAIPGHALGRDTASSIARLLSEGINTVSGGNKYVAGVFSPTPDQIDYLLGQVTGGVGRELSKVEQTVLATARGEDLPTYKVPLVGRFVGDAKSQASEGAAFYANTERLNKLETEIKGLEKDGKRAEAAELRRNSSEAYLITVANQAERQIQRLRAEKRELVKAEAPREQVKAVEERITAVMSRLNRAAESLREKQEN